MFGILRPCRHTLPGDLARDWMSHMCGLCLALRDDHGQLARVATNYDGLVISVLTSAQAPKAAVRAAGPCPLRGMRRADVAEGEGARLAASVSLLLAAAKVDDHVGDGDGAYARPPVRAVARRVAGRWQRQARSSGSGLGFDGGALVAALERQADAEAAAEANGAILTATEPTEFATGEAFAHTALLAGRPGNEAPLREAGRLFGRIAHLLDAVEDQEDDRASGAWNPITATGTGMAEVRRLCDDAVLGVRLALGEAEFTDDRLVRALLVRELERSVSRTFARAGYPGHGGAHGHVHGDGHAPGGPGAGYVGHDGHVHGEGGHGGSGGGPGHPHGPGGPGGTPGPGDGKGGKGGSGGRRRRRRGDHDQGGCVCCCNCETPRIHRPPRPRGALAGCAVALFMCCTCQQCCRDPHPGPWSGRPEEAWCDGCADICEGCGECCRCCSVCEKCDGCDCGCDC
ncbi:DUF5685 family protein [Streptomonospora nanhaiensis]|uniref:Regulatory protein n=1 Tax=Streptomonospora nanhaiensis TaxID=1323731 RepID=A0A853BS97_9ACTN|nr:DUF5685 family protein [Streptomonospora nanhaiensis]MBV2362805.1 regulator [Streptomonospora nanhaiensis]NYI97840.1 hypothetical protein [Streptomonospora nanhaiensis]